MNKIICLVLVLALCILTGSALADANTVSAIGTATVTVEPDMATFSVGITTQDTLVTTAQAANATAMQAILDTLASLGISTDDMQTDNYSVNPVYNYDLSSPTVTGYEVSNTIAVTVRSINQLPALLDAAVEAGANNIYSLSFQSSEESSAYEQALKAASQEALRKAAMMAQAIGREAGITLSLEELTSSSAASTSSRFITLDSATSTPIETGQISVSAQVLAVIEMQ